MKQKSVFSITVVLAVLLTPHATRAVGSDPELISIGTISGVYEDFALNTAAPLENGTAGNGLGGMGSGLAYAGGNTFLAIPDRGPNATPFNLTVDNTASYIPRFQTRHISLAPSGNPAKRSRTDLSGASDIHHPPVIGVAEIVLLISDPL